jgi:hypothetical protein
MSSWPKATSELESSAIPPPQALRERHAAGVDADERDLGEVGVALDDLVRDPRERLRDRLGIEDGRCCRGVGGYVAVRA